MKNCSRGKRGPGSAVLPEELMRTPEVEPGSQAWEACMMPLHYMRSAGPRGTLDISSTQENTQIHHSFYVSGLAAELFFSLSKVLAQICAR